MRILESTSVSFIQPPFRASSFPFSGISEEVGEDKTVAFSREVKPALNHRTWSSSSDEHILKFLVVHTLTGRTQVHTPKMLYVCMTMSTKLT